MDGEKKSVHTGHRERQKERFLKNGFESFADHGVLELLLYYAVPRRDTNVIAHRLLNCFGSLAGVFEATTEELMKIEGLGKNGATLLKMIPQISARYTRSRADRGSSYETATKLGRYLSTYFFGERDEVVYLLTLDGRARIIGCHQLFRGSVNLTQVTARKIAERSLADNAVSVVLAHNHSGGFALPSDEDITATRAIEAALSAIGIVLRDHLIFDEDDFISMRESGLLKNAK
ncbi:MAG: DNA repair protein RadC [Clostridiales bacterium]|jgi:DNA repair protein RadC|nr:DNA repair protein RadC [Clostridiales bacterium]